MPQLGLLERVIQNTLGVAQASVSLTVYREGATVNGNQSGTSPFTVTVRDNGKIKASDTVFVNTTTGTTYNVDSTTDTTIVLSGFAGTLVLTNLDRIRPSNNLPTLYSDDQGGATTTNPPTATGTNGRVSVYTEFGAYDAIASGGSITTTGFESLVVGSEAPGQIRFADSFAIGSTTGGIQEALDDLPAAGGVVRLSGGKTYSPTAKITYPSGTTIQGAGAGSTIIQQPNSTNLAAMFENADTTSGNSNILFSDLTLDGNRANNVGASTVMIRQVGGSDLRIRDCELKEHRGFAVELASSASAALRRVWINGCYIHESAAVGLTNESIRLDMNTATTIEDVFIQGNRFFNQDGAQFIKVAGTTSDTDPIKRVIISNNSFEDAASAFMQIELANDVTVSGNTCLNGAGGIFFVGGASANHTLRNTCVGNTVKTVTGVNNGIEHSGGGSAIAIVGNVVEDVQNTGKFGISAGTAEAVTVSGNSISNCAGGGIVARAASSSTVSGPFNISNNTVKDCTGAAGIDASTNVKGCVVSDNSITNTVRGIKIADNADGAIVDLVVSGNNIQGVTSQGLWIRGRETGTTNATRVRVADNIVRDGTHSGIFMSDVSEALVQDNISHSNDGSGIRFEGTLSDNLVITGNLCYDNGDTNANGDDGIGLAATDHNNVYIAGNMCFDTRSGASRKQDKGIVASNASYGNIILGQNHCRNNITADIDIASTPSSQMGSGTFTCAAAASTTVTCPFVNAGSRILLFPTNASAGTLQAGASALYVSAKTAATSFAVTTANGGAAAGTETFDYVVLP